MDDDDIDAELERQLMEMGAASDDESEDEEEKKPSPDAGLDELPGIAASSDDEGARAAAFCLDDLTSCFQEWESSVDQRAEEAEQGMQQLALDIELRLRAPPPRPWRSDPVGALGESQENSPEDEEDKQVLEKIAAEVLDSTAAGFDPASVERTEQLSAEEDANAPVIDDAASIDAAAEPDLQADASVSQSATDVANQAPFTEVNARELELDQQRIEAELAAHVANLEQERREKLAWIVQEEKMRRAEHIRVREEMAMLSEDLHLHDFYESERRSERNETRWLAAEDRRAANLRNHQLFLQENEERAQEALEQSRLFHEDGRSRRWRCWQNECRETIQMASADTESEVARRWWRRFEELECMVVADAESQHARDMEKAEFERRLMSVEDEHAETVRRCQLPTTFPSGSACSGSSLLGTRPRISPNICLPSQPSQVMDPMAALQALMRPPEMSPPPAGCSAQTSFLTAEANEVVRSSSVLPSTFGKSKPSKIDPWGSKQLQQPAEIVQGGPAMSCDPEAAGSQDDSSTLPRGGMSCSGMLCSALRENLASLSGGGSGAGRSWARLPWLSETEGNLKDSRDKRSPSASSGTGCRYVDFSDALLMEDPEGLKDAIRLDMRMEGLTELPEAVAQASCLRIACLTGNKLADIRPLAVCRELEELTVDQNSLSSLDGLQHLSQLVVLRANMNELVDVISLSQLQELRHVELNKNRLTVVRFEGAKKLAKLTLYRNALDDMSFLSSLPSLTHLDLGRNRIANIDANISQWNPLLIKIFLYENRLGMLPQFQLPLLTDLWVNNNALVALGPLGFLPSLERLQANNNQISTLATPLGESPLLNSFALSFNQISSAKMVQALSYHPRLRCLQLNDNPIAAELMEGYRPWILQMLPQLHELDNETVPMRERWSAVCSHAINDTHLSFDLRLAGPLTLRWPQPPAQEQQSRSAPTLGSQCQASGGAGLLGLLDPGLESSRAISWAADCSISGEQLHAIQRRSVFMQWQNSGDFGHVSCGCDMCTLSCFCEVATAARNISLITYSRDERRSVTPMPGNRQEDCHLLLRRRRKFWRDFLSLCAAQRESMLQSHRESSFTCRTASFEVRGAERSRHHLVSTLQALWRKVMARRRCARLRLDQRCRGFSDEQRARFVCVQAAWRGGQDRSRLRAAGVPLPCDRTTARFGVAVTLLQAAIRGSRVRRKLKWAREMSKLVDNELDDCPEIDLENMFDTPDLDSPFVDIVVPAAVPGRAPRSAGSQCPAQESNALSIAGTVRGSDVVLKPSKAPAMAWGTPPHTAGTVRQEALANDNAFRPISRGGSGSESVYSSASPQSRPGSARVLHRSRSLSVTAESAVTECDGLRVGGSRVDQVQEEWGFKDSATARAYLAAQRRRKGKPPALPAVGSSNNSGASRMGSRTLEPVRKQRGGSTGAGMVKAQDAIKMYQQMQVQSSEVATACSSPTVSQASTLEFQSGEPNQRLLRSSRGRLHQSGSPSPRARSPGTPSSTF